MCKKTNYKTCNVRIDKCIRNLIYFLNQNGYITIASCCGHMKYPITVVVEYIKNGNPYYSELFTNTIIPRKKRFYKKDKEGYYYIPEVSKIKRIRDDYGN